MNELVGALKKVEDHIISQGDFFDHALIIKRAIDTIGELEEEVFLLEIDLRDINDV